MMSFDHREDTINRVRLAYDHVGNSIIHLERALNYLDCAMLGNSIKDTPFSKLAEFDDINMRIHKLRKKSQKTKNILQEKLDLLREEYANDSKNKSQENK